MSQKILCLGNNTEDTDKRTRSHGDSAGLICHGLLSELERPLISTDYALPGYYHSSVYDIEFGKLVRLMDEFDEVVVLDQPVEEWNHPDGFYRTMQIVTKTITPVRFVDESVRQTFVFFSSLVESNKSFCIFPFIEMLVNYDHTTVCCRSSRPITKLSELRDFRTDPGYRAIRKKMLAGELIPEHCSVCYRLESQGIISARQQETVEWAQRLGLENLKDLDTIEKPAYYEVRASNKCNLLCRMCNPESSHLIEREYRKIDLIPKTKITRQKYQTGFDIVDFDQASKIYVAGGEPTVMKEFYGFLRQCIEQKRTDVELLINTNGTNINATLLSLLPHFQNLQFIFSIDGYDRLNHYIRWPSQWNHVIDNWKELRSRGHKVHVNTTVSVYNIVSLYQLYEFIDRNFPNTLVHCNTAENLSPYLFPDRDLALESLSKIQKTDCYHNDPLFASSIDGYFKHFQDSHTPQDLSDFFQFNDSLDLSRSVCLADYVPDLDAYRNNMQDLT
jgi:pyruvate-formate lyase-activating enzyme